MRSKDPEGNPLAGGPRIPAIVISPYARAHVIIHEYSEHSSVIKFIDKLYNMTPLADLPDEVRGRTLGLSELGQKDLGPADDKVTPMGDLFAAFDNTRLTGQNAPLPAEYAMIPNGIVTTLPHFGGRGCYALNMVPADYVDGKLLDPAPADFNPRPGTTPGVPTSGTWTP